MNNCVSLVRVQSLVKRVVRDRGNIQRKLQRVERVDQRLTYSARVFNHLWARVW